MFEAFYQKYLDQHLNKELGAKFFKIFGSMETPFSILIITSVAAVVLFAVNHCILPCIVCAILYVLALVLLIRCAYRNNKKIQKALSDYQSVDDVYERIKKLENLLKHPKFNLYNIDGIEYLSKFCELEARRLNEEKNGIGTILLALISGFLGGIASNIDLSEILIVAFITASALVIVLILYWDHESSARSQRKGYAILQQDLAYIRYQIQTSSLKPTIFVPTSSSN